MKTKKKRYKEEYIDEDDWAFKFTKKKYGEGRRIFKMTPIHHHFQKDAASQGFVMLNKPKVGMHENKITMRFLLIGVLLAVLTFVTLKIR